MEYENMMNKASNILPCPFCGEPETKLSGPIDSPGVHWNPDYFERICGYCGATGPDSQTLEECNEAWNERAAQIVWVKGYQP